MTRIKICGITNLYDALCAARAGADMLGFIFYRKSPRFVAPEGAGSIARGVRETLGTDAPHFVGVFVNASADEVRQVAGAARLDLAQLHGDESPQALRALAPLAFKALRPQSLAQAQDQAAAYLPLSPEGENVPQLLVDAYHPERYGGTGARTDRDIAGDLARRCRLLLAGGLTPNTVGPAIERVHPWGVDVSSGVEAAPGIKDHRLMRAFAAAVRAADRAGSNNNHP